MSLESVFYPTRLIEMPTMELRFALKGESTYFPCGLFQPFIIFIARKIFLLANPHPSCYACNLLSTFPFLRAMLNNYFSNLLSSHVLGTMLGYLHRLAQTLTTVLQSDDSFSSSDGKSDWSKPSQSARGRVKF